MIVFNNQTANGDSEIYQVPGNVNRAFIHIQGTMDGCTITVKYRQDNDVATPLDFITLDGISFTVIDANVIDVAPGAEVILTLSGAGASTDVTASIVPGSPGVA